ncbi:hypothetical protein PAHAL_3G188400 [Panicum hallii]|uniref:Uncharacterized protein n=1 Tax=Panicum hallii TaxID=206008 RepID=A0A2T8KIS2_9POAL|nr:hypothetical protein PAHAL_3G188400 [Panicum hallii]
MMIICHERYHQLIASSCYRLRQVVVFLLVQAVQPYGSQLPALRPPPPPHPPRCRLPRVHRLGRPPQRVPNPILLRRQLQPPQRERRRCLVTAQGCQSPPCRRHGGRPVAGAGAGRRLSIQTLPTKGGF